MSKLYIVPTPIGNLQDMTMRGLDVLKNVDLILAEDTRTTNILLNHYGIITKSKSYHSMNEHKIVDAVSENIKNGCITALVSDSGTPSISDPGYLLINHCINKNIPIECLPGATAFVPALVCSGMPADKFCFEGFLPHKKGRIKRIKELADEKRTIIFYESPKRLIKTILQLIEHFGKDRIGSISREISKVYEEHKRGTLAELYQYFKEKTVKGEIVIVVKGKNR